MVTNGNVIVLMFLQAQVSNEMEWSEEEEDYNPGISVFKGVPIVRTCFY